MHLLMVTGEPKYLDAAEIILKAQSAQLSRDIIGSASLLAGLDSYSRPRLAFLTGKQGTHRTALKTVALSEADPAMLSLLDHPQDRDGPKAVGSQPIGQAGLFLCEAMSCRPPVATVEDLQDLLAETRQGAKHTGPAA